MSFWKIVLKSLKHHRFSNGLAAISIAMGIALLVAVYSFKEQSQKTFTQSGLGIDAILAPKGSPLQIVLNAVYHLEDMPGKIKWSYFKEVEKERIVSQAIPFVVGHSYGGVRVNAIDPKFLSEFEYLPGRKFSFSEKEGGEGRPFSESHEAVAGWAAAKHLNIRLGQTFNPVCGVQERGLVHEKDLITFVGILAPTGTPHDRAIYIPLETFYGLEGHPQETMIMAEQEEYREISGAYIKIKRIRGGAIHPGIQDLKFAINQSDRNQLVVPAEVMPRLHDIIGWMDRVLIAIAIILTVLSSLFLFFSLLQSLREMRRELALFRALGATRKSVMGFVIFEALIISLLGGIIGLALGHWLIGMGAHFIKVETGVAFTAGYISIIDWVVIPGAALLGLLAGLVPGIQAYRLGVLQNLSPMS
ncbi:MAG: ABC transporter permease [Deltaproteobacteria bacterium]|nr:ABC transporter permease [Deltaproteobacteria bacterium]MBW1861959.1 ABC transporter permease [Deltaproteobacteria bacterium]